MSLNNRHLDIATETISAELPDKRKQGKAATPAPVESQTDAKVVDQKEPEPEVEVMEPAAEVVETPPVTVVDTSLKSNPFAVLATPPEFTA